MDLTVARLDVPPLSVLILRLVMEESSSPQRPKNEAEQAVTCTFAHAHPSLAPPAKEASVISHL